MENPFVYEDYPLINEQSIDLFDSIITTVKLLDFKIISGTTTALGKGYYKKDTLEINLNNSYNIEIIIVNVSGNIVLCSSKLLRNKLIINSMKAETKLNSTPFDYHQVLKITLQWIIESKS